MTTPTLFTYISNFSRAPNNQDNAVSGLYPFVGSLLGISVSAFAQNIQAKGILAAITGSRLGLTELNWTSLGSALVVGAAIGASVSIAVYLVRERQRAKILSEERNSPSSPTNVSLEKMQKVGPDAWAINRILEKDAGAFSRIEAAVLVHTMELTHTNSVHAKPHAVIALAAALRKRAGDCHPSVRALKKKLMSEMSAQLNESPSAKLLLNTLTQLPALMTQTSALDMHAAWNTIINKHMVSPDAKTFAAQLSDWTNTYYPNAQNLMVALPEKCFDSLVEMSKDHVNVIAIYAETAQTDAMVASMLLGTPVIVKATKELSNSTLAFSSNDQALG